MTAARRVDPDGDLERAGAYLESRFPCNARERLEGAGRGLEALPHFVLVRTRLGCLWRFREDLGRAAVRELTKLAGREGPLRFPAEAFPPPERVEPMARVLRDAGMDVEALRDLLSYRAGWRPTERSVAAIAFRVDARHEGAGSAPAPADAQLASSSWKRRGELAQLDARQWIRFADLICLVEKR